VSLPTYYGRLDVDPPDFPVEARLQVFPDRVAFAFSGHDNGGPYRAEGIATRTSDGRFIAIDVPVQCTRGGRCELWFWRVTVGDNSCELECEWKQDGYATWTLSGELDLE
jgi:hypothetical protein